MQDGDVGADGEVSNAHVEVLLRLVCGLNFRSGGNTCCDRGLEDLVVRGYNVRVVALSWLSDAH